MGIWNAHQRGQNSPATPEDLRFPLQWRVREALYFWRGTYVAPPWEAEDWAQDPAIQDHFCHLALTQEGMLAYTENEQTGRENRTIRISPRAYLQKFASKSLKSQEIDLWVKRAENFFKAFPLKPKTEAKT